MLATVFEDINIKYYKIFLTNGNVVCIGCIKQKPVAIVPMVTFYIAKNKTIQTINQKTNDDLDRFIIKIKNKYHLKNWTKMNIKVFIHMLLVALIETTAQVIL